MGRIRPPAAPGRGQDRARHQAAILADHGRDQAKIDVHVSLPCAPGSDDLADEYIWGDEIVLFGKPLNPDWGKMIAKGKRTVIFTAMGSTFAEAFEGAENDVAVKLMPLADAMDARKERMRAADWRL